jgi:hypothetical protein
MLKAAMRPVALNRALAVQHASESTSPEFSPSPEQCVADPRPCQQ